MIERVQFIKSINIKWDEISDESYIRNIPAIASLEEMTFDNPITFFVGENGSGKSTLLEGIAVAYGFNPEGGTKNYMFSTYDSHSELCDAIRLVKGYRRATRGYFLRAESFYNVATKEEEISRGGGGYYIPREFHKKSHGESFLHMAKTYFGANGMFIMDEPEAALSPSRQIALMYEIRRAVKEGSQFIIATHSPILLGMPDSEIMCFDDGKIHKCAYEDTESYRIIEMFINNREEILNKLFSKDIN